MSVCVIWYKMSTKCISFQIVTWSTSGIWRRVAWINSYWTVFTRPYGVTGTYFITELNYDVSAPLPIRTNLRIQLRNVKHDNKPISHFYLIVIIRYSTSTFSVRSFYFILSPLITSFSSDFWFFDIHDNYIVYFINVMSENYSDVVIHVDPLKTGHSHVTSR